MSETITKSIITCDLEGRIETFSQSASEVFGYDQTEIIGKKRVSLFSPGLTVLEHVPQWLSLAVKNGAHETKTVFVRKDGTRFPAKIKITPTFRNGKQIGYCGVTHPLPEDQIASAAPAISLSTRIFAGAVITRAPFLTATIVPVVIGAALAKFHQTPWSWSLFMVALIGACALQVAANTFNDYFDWKSGADPQNNEYFLPFSGGSRSIELGLITEKGLWNLSIMAMSIATLCGLFLALQQGPVILAYGLVGAFAAYFYTAPPLRLVARRGLGELFVGLCFGPLLCAGSYTAMTQQVRWESFAAGIPVGLLTTAILWINEFPDAASDAKVGKNHLVVTLGKKTARWGYLGLLAGAYLILGFLILTNVVPALAALATLSLPIAASAVLILFKNYDRRELVAGNRNTILLQLLFGILMCVGVLLGTH